MRREQLLSTLNSLLSPHLYKDYCPNGLQIEGKDTISRVVTGVTASQALIDEAIALNADAILVHHGFFWKNEDYAIIGMKKRRISALLNNDINLYAYHLPLDAHSELGNNAQLGKLLDLQNITALKQIEPLGIVMTGELKASMSHNDFASHISTRLNRECVQVANNLDIKKVAWCTGGGQGFIDEVAKYSFAQNHQDHNDGGQSQESSGYSKIDAFISGEISEQTTHSARELGIDYFAAGHHATERYGVKALGEYLAKTHGLDVRFVDIDNPA